MASNAQFARSLERLIYQLTKQFESGPVDIYYDITIGGCVESGKRTIESRSMVRVDSAVLLPESAVKAIIQSISKIGADKQFVYGGEYRRDTRFFLLDGAKLASVNLCVNDWLVYNNAQKYEIVDLDDYYDGALYIVQGREQPGDAFSQIHSVDVYDALAYDETVVDT